MTNKVGRPKTVEKRITIGVKNETYKRLGHLGFHLNCSLGSVVDMLTGETPHLSKKVTKAQKRTLKATIMRQGRKKCSTS